MDIREQVLGKYQEFNTYLENIDIQPFRQNYSRQELNEFKSKLDSIHLRSLGYEISKLIKAMKEEEFPQLLGVHHYPVIQEMTFLNDAQKLKLDEYLVKHRVGNFVYGLWRVISNDALRKQAEDWLEEKAVIQKHYVALCPKCHQGHLSKYMSLANKELLEKAHSEFKKTYSDDSYTQLSGVLENSCMECDDYTEFEDMKELRFKSDFKMMMERDKHLDEK